MPSPTDPPPRSRPAARARAAARAAAGLVASARAVLSPRGRAPEPAGLRTLPTIGPTGATPFAGAGTAGLLDRGRPDPPGTGAFVDHLTGLPNHRLFAECLERAVASARPRRMPLAVAMLDLDRMRELNQRHGHQIGDRVVSQAANRMRRLLRPDQTLARVGGDEFALILPGIDGTRAHAAVERMRAAISADPTDPSLSASAGVCDLERAGTAEDLMRLAGGALYWAKAHGRGRTVIYSPEVVRELSAEERIARLEREAALVGLGALARAVDAKDPSTRRHSERVADLAVRLAADLGWGDVKRAMLREAALLHDVGKIGVPDAVLFKDGRLTPDEFEQVQAHAAIGAEIAHEVLMPEQVGWIRHHHERWDGGGYPDGIARDAIPVGARILTLADSWDVMTSERTYKGALDHDEAAQECRRCRGTQFWPDVVDALLRLRERGALARLGEPPRRPDPRS